MISDSPFIFHSNSSHFWQQYISPSSLHNTIKSGYQPSFYCNQLLYLKCSFSHKRQSTGHHLALMLICPISNFFVQNEIKLIHIVANTAISYGATKSFNSKHLHLSFCDLFSTWQATETARSLWTANFSIICPQWIFFCINVDDYVVQDGLCGDHASIILVHLL